MNNIVLPSETLPEITNTDETSLLVIILDSNPGQKMLRDNPHILTHCLDSVIPFANSHLMQRSQNKLAILACHSKTRYVYVLYIKLWLKIVKIWIINIDRNNETQQSSFFWNK